MSIVRVSSGKEFPVTDGEVVLDAALRAGVTLPYSCRTGRCNTCKARVISGSTRPRHAEIGLSDTDRFDGWILTCARTVSSSVELEVAELSDLNLPPPKMIPCRIQSLVKLSDKVLQVKLRLPPRTTFEYRSGQYVEVIGQDGLQRSYSIANAPSVSSEIELHVGRVLGGIMSGYWFDRAKVNDLLRLRGPFGTFFVRNVDGVDLVFMATGTGIAPIKAMLEDISRLVGIMANSVAVYWGGRHSEDIYWDPLLLPLKHSYTPVLSKANHMWQGARGYVQQEVLRTSRDWSRVAVYACGSDDMIRDAKMQLIAAGLGEQQFFSDAFVCSAS